MSSTIFQKSLLTNRACAVTIHYMKTRVVIVNISSCEKLLAMPERFCSVQRLEKCAAIGNPSVRMQGYAAELALSFALSGEALLPPEYGYEESGRPVIKNGYVSLTHSGGWAACAVSNAPIGVDLEQIRPIGRGIARRILSPIERREFEACSDTNYLLRKFVMKEAFFKMTGEGISGGFRDVMESNNRLFRCGVLAGFPHHFEDRSYLGCVVTAEEGSVEYIDLADRVFADK